MLTDPSGPMASGKVGSKLLPKEERHRFVSGFLLAFCGLCGDPVRGSAQSCLL